MNISSLFWIWIQDALHFFRGTYECQKHNAQPKRVDYTNRCFKFISTANFYFQNIMHGSPLIYIYYKFSACSYNRVIAPSSHLWSLKIRHPCMYSGQSILLNYDISSPFSLKNGIDQTTHICNIPKSHRTSTNIC